MRSPTELLQGAFTIFKENVKLFFLIFIIPAIISILAILTLLPSAYTDNMMPVLTVLPLYVLILAVVNILMSLAMIKVVASPSDTTVKSAYSFAAKNFWSYVWVSVLVGLATLGGFILLIIPGIIFMIWFMFSYYVLLFEGKKGTDALKGSREHVRGRWWAVFGRLLFFLVIMLIVSFAFGLIFGMDSNQRDAKPLEQIGSMLLNFVLMPISLAYLYLMYQDLKGSALPTQQNVTPTPQPPIGNPTV